MRALVAGARSMSRPAVMARQPAAIGRVALPGARWLQTRSVLRAEPGLEDKLADLNDKFAEARLEIQDALDSAETVYFNEDAEFAMEAAAEVVKGYEGIIASLEGDEKELGKVKTSWGMRIEQLKQEVKLLEDTDH